MDFTTAISTPGQLQRSVAGLLMALHARRVDRRGQVEIPLQLRPWHMDVRPMAVDTEHFRRARIHDHRFLRKVGRFSRATQHGSTTP